MKLKYIISIWIQLVL